MKFIAAARRTRDLWLGSHLLSEISRSVAKAVLEKQGVLIFPSVDDENTLRQVDNVANVILAEIETSEPEKVATLAKAAAQARWLEFAQEAKRDCNGAIDEVRWKEQVDDVIEFFAAWVPCTANYSEDRARVMRLLAGRKNCKDFFPAIGHAGIPKSSLDGQRESVLKKDPDARSERFKARARVREGEQLDVVGLVKRLAGGQQSYPSVSRVAADPWIRGNVAQLVPVLAACEKLAENREILRPMDTKKYPQFSAFPFEGTIVYANRHHELEFDDDVAEAQLGPLKSALNSVNAPEPAPYLAVLVADGDKMGAALSKLESSAEHRAFSTALAGFAVQAKKIVQEQNGFLVYAGGDDVVAFLPVDKAVKCARELHDAFGKALNAYGSPTLSVGIAIGHFLENLEDLLEYGRAAERAAKSPDRDGLAIHLHKRSGAPITYRVRWSDSAPDVRLRRYADLMRAGAIPTKLPYDLRPLEQVYDRWLKSDKTGAALKKDVIRIIRDKQPSEGKRYMEEVVTLVEERVKDLPTLRTFGSELLIARHLAEAQWQAHASLTHMSKDI